MKKTFLALLFISMALIALFLYVGLNTPETTTMTDKRDEAEILGVRIAATLCVTWLAGCLLGMLSTAKVAVSCLKTSRSLVKRSVVIVLGVVAITVLALLEGALVLLLREYMKVL